MFDMASGFFILILGFIAGFAVGYLFGKVGNK